jgi:methylthioribose-1-phosphate isomerase
MRVNIGFSTARSFFMPAEARQRTDKTLVPIKWLPEGKVRFLDQTLLPHEEVWVETDDYQVVAEAIRRLQVRGAPLIGVAAAYGLALAALATDETDLAPLQSHLRSAADELAGTRPTAVNLAWALERMLRAAQRATNSDGARETLVEEARRIHEEDIAANKVIGANGAALLREQSTVLTHCNAGALATGGYGTALGVIRSAAADSRLRHVIATETRPLLQGARLTAWELARDGISFELIVDSAAGSMLRRGLVDAVIVGADRIAANGDVANKIGTYQLAVLARENKVPFYVAAPTSTIDLSVGSGDDIPIEERSAAEVTSLRGIHLAPDGGNALNPAFDVTPNTFVDAIITENGVARPPYHESLLRVCESEVPVRG